MFSARSVIIERVILYATIQFEYNTVYLRVIPVMRFTPTAHFTPRSPTVLYGADPPLSSIHTPTRLVNFPEQSVFQVNQ